MSWLLWREYRLNRQLAFAALGLMFTPYIMLAIAVVISWVKGWPIPDSGQALGVLALYSIALSQVGIVFMGGNAIAGERSDRSAEYIAFLPIARSQRLFSKLLVSLIATAVTWLPNLLLLLVVAATVSFHPRDVEGAKIAIWMIAISAITAYAVAWMASSFQKSPTFAVCAGLITPMVTVAAIQILVIEVFEIAQPYSVISVIYSVICSVIAVVTFSLGTWYFLQRVEP